MQSHLAEAWGEFLGRFLWDWFCTLTFRELVPSFTAHRRFEYFMRDLERAAGLPIAWFRADEYGPHGGRLHLHALVLNVAHLRRLTWMDRWNERNGYARILPFDPARPAAYYCAKYVTKQFGDWDLSNNVAAFGQYQPGLFGSSRENHDKRGTRRSPRETLSERALRLDSELETDRADIGARGEPSD